MFGIFRIGSIPIQDSASAALLAGNYAGPLGQPINNNNIVNELIASLKKNCNVCVIKIVQPHIEMFLSAGSSVEVLPNGIALNLNGVNYPLTKKNMAWKFRADGMAFMELLPTNGKRLEFLQASVGGDIECIPIHEHWCLVVNEDGKLKNLPQNPFFPGLVGSAVFAWVD